MKLQPPVNRNGIWWVPLPDDPIGMGPYATRGEADDDRVGVQRMMRHESDREYFTTEKERS